MTAALQIALAAGFYFVPGTPVDYEMAVSLKGTLPVLGGREGHLELAFGVRVEGLEPDGQGKRRVRHELTSFRAVLNGAALPFNLSNVQASFPRTTLAYNEFGMILSTDAPSKELPAMLPGLDSQRFPEISYLPIELPNPDADQWRFERTISGLLWKYSASWKPGTREVVAEAACQGVQWEDGSGKPVAGREGAEMRIEVTARATSTVEFSPDGRRVVTMKTKVTTESDVKGIVNDFHGKRKLETTIVLKERRRQAILTPCTLSFPSGRSFLRTRPPSPIRLPR